MYNSYGDSYFLYIVLIIIVLVFILSKKIENYHSRWNTLIDDFNFSTQEFYQLLKEELLNNKIHGINIGQVSLNVGGPLSSQRIYLRVTWKEYQYDVCAAPFGKGFFVSWWLMYNDSIAEILISKIPFIGTRLLRKLYPITYYRIDSASMFMTYAQSSVLKVIDDITNGKGVRALTEAERKPVLNDIFVR